MTIEQLQAIHQATPFKPCIIHLADGRSWRVPHRDFLSHTPGGRTLFVVHGDEAFSVVDLLLVTELEVPNGRAARSKKARERR
jgi:hypothetical protein